MVLKMKPGNKDYIFAVFMAIPLFALGVVTIFYKNVCALALVKMIPATLSESYELQFLGGFTIAVSILVLLRTTRSVGWVLTGGVGAAYLLVAHLIHEESSKGIFSLDSEYPIVWLYWVFVVFLLIALLIAVGHDNAVNQARGVYLQNIETLNSDKLRLSEDNEKSMADKVAAVKSAKAARESVQGIKDNHKIEIADLEADLATEKTAHHRTKQIRPYESQLVAAFCISLGIKWQQLKPNSLLSLNNFQGNLDKNFGDFVGLTDGVCWLIEMKRNWSSVARESEKPIRRAQYSALRGIKPEFFQTAKKCHWLGWGVMNNNEANLKFGPYWDTWEQASPPKNAFSHQDFVERAFPKTTVSGAATKAQNIVFEIGVSPYLFAEYIHFLAENTGGAVDEDADIIAALVFQMDAAGNVRYWVQQDLMKFAQTISEKFQEIRKRDDLDHGHGHSFGR